MKQFINGIKSIWKSRIDAAIDSQNEEEFYRLSKQYAVYVIHE